MRKVLILLIVFYQRFFSGFFSLLFSGGCRFRPTCSCYCQEAITRYGVVRGVFLGLKRIIRCHPLGQPSYDPVL